MKLCFNKFGFNALWLLIFSLLVGVFLIFMPKYVDDYVFMYNLRHWFFGQGILNPENGGNIFSAGIPWDDITTTWREKYMNDNSRFGNIAVVLFLIFPKWLGSSLVWLGWIWIMISGLRLINVPLRTSPLVPLAIFLWAFFMPWRDHMGSLDFQFNYLVPNALLFWLFAVFCRYRKAGSLSFRKYVSLFLLAFVCGGWQEALALPVALTCIGMLCARSRWRSAAAICATAGLVCGLLWIFSARGQWIRMTGVASFISYNLTLPALGRSLMCTFMYMTLVVTALVTFLRKFSRGEILRSLLDDARLVFMLVSGLLSTGIVFFTYSDARVGWWSTTMGIFGILYILNKYYPMFRLGYSTRGRWLSAILLVAVFIHWIAVDIQVFRIRRSLLHAIDTYTAAPNESVFADVIDRHNIPLICANMPALGVYTYGSWGIIDYYKEKFGTLYAAIPKELEYVTPEKATRIPGTAGMLEYGGRYFIPYEISGDAPSLWCDYGSGLAWKKSWSAPFVSKADGRKYMYVYIYENLFEITFSHPKRVDILQ